MKVAIYQTSWGSATAGIEPFLERAQDSGFDGVEVFMPDPTTALARLAEERGLDLLGHIYSTGGDSAAHVAFLREAYLRAIDCGPRLVNCQTGRDHFSFDNNLRIFEAAADLVRDHGVAIHHETHRSRPTFSIPATLKLLRALPDLTLTLDLSHWMVVHESDLRDQQATLDEILGHARHLHARVGHAEGPQVPDPRDEAWHPERARHLDLWRSVVQRRATGGDEHLTITTEFGPAPYLPAEPFSGKPVADQWAINVFVRDWLRTELVHVTGEGERPIMSGTPDSPTPPARPPA
ncbi:MAG: TIM barrel protein [bacterium]|nr:TIM barrel protein [bacterium]